MPKTRSMLGRSRPTQGAAAAAAASDSEDDTAVARRSTRRTALGDVSNRGSKRSSTQEGAKNARATRNNRHTDSGDDEAPTERQRSLRAYTRAQRLSADPSDEPTAARRMTRSTSRKRIRDEDEEDDMDSSSSRPLKRGRTASRATASRGRSSSRRSKSKGSEDAGRKAIRPKAKSPNLCNDLLYQAGHGLVRSPMNPAKYTVGIAAHDSPKPSEERDVCEAVEYVTDIFQRLYHAETESCAQPYMEIQDDINSTMRAILIDWLVEVHMKFRLVPQTLYLCVNIIDRYLAQVQVERKKLQLVGVTALLVACKYEEIYPPEVRDCVYITDRTYTRQEVLDMEQSIVRVLEFKLTAPHGHNFLTRFLKITKAPELVSTAANYYMERTLQEYVFLNYRPSLVAAAAVCLAWNNSDVIENTGDNSINPPGVPQILLDYTGFLVSAIKKCAQHIVDTVEEEVVTASGRELVAVKRKFDNSKYEHISTEIRNPDYADIEYF